MRLFQSATLHRAGQQQRLAGKPLVMGIVNITPDSFSDGGQFFDPRQAVEHALQLIADGADWLDIGGESTRPGAEPVAADEECRRVLPIIESLAWRQTVPLSIDTSKPEVAARALQAGATIINDVTGFRDPKMIEVAAASDAALVCMHMRGTPQTMNQLAHYDDVWEELRVYFQKRLATLKAAGIEEQRVLLDPGIGFAKRTAHNVAILRHLEQLQAFGRPILLGVSRKRVISALTGRAAGDRAAGTLAASLLGYLRGAHVLRVHDVAATVDALAVMHALAGDEE